MKKLFRTLILCMLVLTMAVSAFACGDEGQEETVKPVEKLHYEGTHIQNQTDTGKYLVKDGATDYIVVADKGRHQCVDYAKQDIVILFRRATGITLDLVVDDGTIEWNEDAKYISLGYTSLVDQAGIDPEEYSYELLHDEGARILTKGNTIFLLNAAPIGMLNAVYVLYEMMFNFDAFERDCIYIDTNVMNVPLMNYDVTEMPDVKHCEIGDRIDWLGAACNTPNDVDNWYYGSTVQQEVSLRGARARNYEYGFGTLTMPAHPNNDPLTGGYTNHTMYDAWLSPACGYIDPKWKSDSGTQACFTAHGDSDSLEAFVNHVATIAINSIKRYPTEQYPLYKVMQITCQDGTTTTCMCEACSKIAEANNGAYIASHIMFINKVNEILQPWFESIKDDPELSKYYRPQFEMQLFAYQITNTPPVYIDEETGVATPCTDEVICAKGTNVFYVQGRGYYSIYAEQNKDNINGLNGWNVLTPESDFWFWINAGNHSHTTFWDGLASFNNDWYEVLAYYGVGEAYIAYHWGYQDVSAFQNVLYYVNKKLRWNVHYNMDELIDAYFKNMYGDGADIMRNLYENLKVYWYGVKARIEARNEGVCSAGQVYAKEYWPVDFNVWWYEEIEKAVAEVEKNPLPDENQQKVLVQRIRKEEIAPLFNLIDLHGKGNQREVTDEQLVEYKALLYDVAKHYPNMNPGYSSVSGKILDRTK